MESIKFYVIKWATNYEQQPLLDETSASEIKFSEDIMPPHDKNLQLIFP
jgi:hypothetical protein